MAAGSAAVLSSRAVGLTLAAGRSFAGEGWLLAAPPDSAPRNDAMLSKRSSRARAKAHMMAASTWAGTSAANSCKGGGVAVRCMTSISVPDAATCGVLPASIS